MDLIAVRPMRESDEAFVFSSWLTAASEAWARRWAHESGAELTGLTAAQIAAIPRTFTRAHVAGILNRPTCTVRVACVEDDTDAIVGWCAAEPGVVHWTHVKHYARRTGIGATLLENAHPGWRTHPRMRCSYLSHVWPVCRARGWTFDPHAEGDTHAAPEPVALVG